MWRLEARIRARRGLDAAWLTAAATLILSACGSAGMAPALPAVSASPGNSPVVPSPSPDARAGVDAALREAAAQLGLGRDELRVERVEARDWPDSSLGCPQPGMLYAQVVTPGYLVVVVGGGKQLEYHTDARARALLCQER